MKILKEDVHIIDPITNTEVQISDPNIKIRRWPEIEKLKKHIQYNSNTHTAVAEKPTLDEMMDKINEIIDLLNKAGEVR